MNENLPTSGTFTPAIMEDIQVKAELGRYRIRGFGTLRPRTWATFDDLTFIPCGLTRIPLRHYVITTLVCMIPGAVAYTWLGHAGRGALSGDAGAVRYGLLGLGLLAAIALLPRLISRLRTSFAWIGVSELRHRLDCGDAVAVIDVRGPEFIGALGHIATARNIPIAELDNRLAELAGLERAPIVLVCRTDKRSAAAAHTLRAAGFSQVSVLRRGMQQWNEAGLPVMDRTVCP